MSAFPQSVTELCQVLVRIPSVNPDGEAGMVVEWWLEMRKLGLR